MRYPEFLQPGGSIGFAAPSFGVNIEPYRSSFDNAEKRFQALGYRTVKGPNVYEGKGIGISNTPEKCGAELNDLYLSPDTDVLISVGGGELMCEDLDFIDFEKIRAAKPKWYMGYSDNTNFGFLLATLCDTASLYAPCAGEFGMEPLDPSCQDAIDLLTGKNRTVHGYEYWEKTQLKDAEHPLAPFNLTEKTAIRTYNWDGSPITGRFIGGCMDCLVNLSGTCYDQVPAFTERYREDGIIFFLESCDLNVFSIRRALWQLKHTGWFRHVKAFLIGRPLCMGQELMGLDQYEAVLGILSAYHVPILMDLDLGHLSPMMPMVNGGYGTLRPYGDNIEIEFKF